MYQQLVNLGVSGYHIGKLALTDDHKTLEGYNNEEQNTDEKSAEQEN